MWVDDAYKECSMSHNPVKLEGSLSYDAVCISVKIEPDASSTVQVDVKYPLKYESATFGCTICFQEFSHEHDYNAHMSVHLQLADCEASRTYQPRTTASSGCQPSHFSEHKYAVQKLYDSRPSADLAQTLVANPHARLATNNELPLTEETDRSKKRKLVHEINELGIKTNTTVNKLTKRVKIDRKFVESRKSISTCDNHYVTGSKDSHSGNKATEDRSSKTKTSLEATECTLYGINVRSTEGICFKCDFCQKTFKRKSLLVEHIKSHKLCQDISGSNLEQMKTQTCEESHYCNLCGYKCSQDSALVRHMRTHTGEKPFSCKMCEYKCAHKNSLVLHMLAHNGVKPYSCEICKYQCSQTSALVSHRRTHTGEKPYSCELCEYKCAHNSSLVLHTLAHTGEKPYSCTVCDYKCAQNKYLVQHMRKHTGEKPYSCKLCDYKCAYSSSLVLHMVSHTSEKPYSCKLCDYKCALNKNLVAHLRTHTGERPHSCMLCEYKCAQKSDLVKHMRTHTGEKPYSCQLCEYKSARNTHLQQHMRTHTGEKPFSCKLCEYKCARNTHLRQHMRKHTNEKSNLC